MGVENTPKKSAENEQVTGLLRETFPQEIEEVAFPQGDATVQIRPESVGRVMEFLKSDSRCQFDLLVDLTAVDHLGREPRFDIVYHMLSLPHNRRLRVKLRIGGNEPVVTSVTPLWGAADWLEREVWDMFGIRFAGHPNLKRILMYEQFQGHPLRKDYPMRKRQPLIGPKN
jgi:NADH-quinone oxidoreductase subunit C